MVLVKSDLYSIYNIMPAKRQIKINRKKKEPVVEEVKEEVKEEVEVKKVTLEEAMEEITKEEPAIEEKTPVTTAIESKISDERQVMFTKSQLKGEIVGKWTRTVMQRPRWRIKFEAQVAAVPLFKLPEDIRRYLVSNWLPTTVWQWDKEKLEKRKVNMKMVEKLKEFLSSMN